MERYYDEVLGIETLGYREWDDEPEYYRCESTPYRALAQLAKDFPLKEDHHVVDFGCGRGRVSFYLHHLFNLRVTGIELHEETFAELKENEQSYLQRKDLEESPFTFLQCHVEDFIPEDQDVFYFFNPFSVKIFRKVLANIERSLEEKDRECYLILYYPFIDYKYYLEKYTTFEKVLRIRLDWEEDEREKFIIYRHLPLY